MTTGFPLPPNGNGHDSEDERLSDLPDFYESGLPDLADFQTVSMAIIEIQEAVRAEYAALGALHRVAVSRARSQIAALQQAAEKEIDTAAKARLLAFIAALAEIALEHEQAITRLRRETGGPSEQ